MADARLRILYDADCGFCRWSVARLLKADQSLCLVPVTIQSAEGQRLLAAVPVADRLASAHCVTAEGIVFSGGAAYTVVAKLVPALRHTSGLAEAMPKVVDIGYRGVANNRRLFSRWMTPDRLAWADRVISERIFEAQDL